MGILKDIKDSIMGEQADVTLNLVNDVVDEDGQLEASLTIKAKDKTIISESVYVIVKAFEESAITKTIYEEKVELEKTVQLNANDEKTWPVTIQIPESAPSTYFGKHSKLDWKLTGGIEMPVVNPQAEARFVVDRVNVFPTE
ncbi:MAG: hypothetical protein JXR10_00090 [Cyclobacteriaceae bacterium]